MYLRNVIVSKTGTNGILPGNKHSVMRMLSGRGHYSRADINI